MQVLAGDGLFRLLRMAQDKAIWLIFPPAFENARQSSLANTTAKSRGSFICFRHCLLRWLRRLVLMEERYMPPLYLAGTQPVMPSRHYSSITHMSFS